MATNPGDWLRCRYFSFSDVPLTFIWKYNGKTLFMASEFREDLDEYDPNYQVYELEQVSEEELDSLTFLELESRTRRRYPEIPKTEFRWQPVRERAEGRFYAQMRYLGVSQIFDEKP